MNYSDGCPDAKLYIFSSTVLIELFYLTLWPMDTESLRQISFLVQNKVYSDSNKSTVPEITPSMMSRRVPLALSGW